MTIPPPLKVKDSVGVKEILWELKSRTILKVNIKKEPHSSRKKYTTVVYMPIVCYYLSDKDVYEIVDGFHRYQVMRTSKRIHDRENGHIPVVTIDRPISNQMASTIRHNRARGSHSIELMTNIVKELVESRMSDAWIMRNIGMNMDELLRLKQLSGLASLFENVELRKAWETEDDR